MEFPFTLTWTQDGVENSKVFATLIGAMLVAVKHPGAQITKRGITVNYQEMVDAKAIYDRLYSKPNPDLESDNWLEGPDLASEHTRKLVTA